MFVNHAKQNPFAEPDPPAPSVPLPVVIEHGDLNVSVHPTPTQLDLRNASPTSNDVPDAGAKDDPEIKSEHRLHLTGSALLGLSYMSALGFGALTTDSKALVASHLMESYFCYRALRETEQRTLKIRAGEGADIKANSDNDRFYLRFKLYFFSSSSLLNTGLSFLLCYGHYYPGAASSFLSACSFLFVAISARRSLKV